VPQQQSFQANTVEDPGAACKPGKIVRQDLHQDISVCKMLSYCKGRPLGRLAVKHTHGMILVIIVFKPVPDPVPGRGGQHGTYLQGYGAVGGSMGSGQKGPQTLRHGDRMGRAQENGQPRKGQEVVVHNISV